MQVFLLVTFKILPAFFEAALGWFDSVNGDDAPVSGVADDAEPAESESHGLGIRRLDVRPAGGESGERLLRIDAPFSAPGKRMLCEVNACAHISAL